MQDLQCLVVEPILHSYNFLGSTSTLLIYNVTQAFNLLSPISTFAKFQEWLVVQELQGSVDMLYVGISGFVVDQDIIKEHQ